MVGLRKDKLMKTDIETLKEIISKLAEHVDDMESKRIMAYANQDELKNIATLIQEARYNIIDYLKYNDAPMNVIGNISNMLLDLGEKIYIIPTRDE